LDESYKPSRFARGKGLSFEGYFTGTSVQVIKLQIPCKMVAKNAVVKHNTRRFEWSSGCHVRSDVLEHLHCEAVIHRPEYSE